ncbi:hypothetical protein FQR65_LT07209 [Abscondita terminalis]|nr:hypothetical protein FQR65_LT07209 [Abscondita terminalis]
MNMRCTILLVGLLALGNCELSGNIARARIDTCSGCQLYDLPDVKAFIFDDFTNYANTELKLVPGAPPVLLFLDKSDEVVERINLKPLSRKECNEVLIKHGFEKKPGKDTNDEL